MRNIRREPLSALLKGACGSLLLIVVAATSLLVANALRPVPPVETSIAPPSLAPTASDIDIGWPQGGEAALGIDGQGVLAATPDPRPLPTASTAKIMTALVTLEARPLRKGESGPRITMTAQDEAAYRQDQGQGQSVVAVAAGEQLSEYQALQALLLPSANNIAEVLARWAYGSLNGGVARMNERARELQMRSTHFVDASGFNPGTVSTPADLVVLGELAMRNPVIAEIVAQTQAVLPVAGLVTNVNNRLGQAGIFGIKTGNTDQAGGCYVFAAPYQAPGGRRLLIVGAVMGMPDLESAMAGAPALVENARRALQPRRVLEAGQVVGRYRSAWGQATEVVAARPVDLLLWQGTVVATRVEMRAARLPVEAGAEVGRVTVVAAGQTARVPVVTREAISEPGWRWRARRPFPLPPLPFPGAPSLPLPGDVRFALPATPSRG
jgi:serine-type D-Ala-D-Ala carboxypeptidase (penicillin-binding protein 5/6)